jgi:hypothetical protein
MHNDPIILITETLLFRGVKMLVCPLLINEETPEPLSDICLKYICSNLDTISYADISNPSIHHLSTQVVMPNEICERLLQVLMFVDLIIYEINLSPVD